jgi:hypothetical protein
LPGAVDYRNATLSAIGQYRLSETDSLSASGGHTDYRALSGATRSASDDISIGASRVLSERTSASISIGANRTRTTAQTAVLACPLRASLCQAGIVPYIVVLQPGETSSHGLQYSASYQAQMDELTGLSFSIGRQQAPTGLGSVSRSDTLTTGASHAFSETLSASASFTRSRSTLQGVDGAPSPGLQTLGLSLTKALTPEISLFAGWTLSRADDPSTGVSARSNAVSVTLKYQWLQYQATR